MGAATDIVETPETRIGGSGRVPPRYDSPYQGKLPLSISLTFSLPARLFLIMIRLQNSCYLIVSILLAVEVLSSPQLQDSALSGNPDLALISGAKSSDVPNWDQGSLIASGDPQGQNLWLGDSNLLSHQGGSDTNILPDTSKDSAFQFDGNDGVTNVVPPAFPIPLRIFFPNGLPQFDPDGVIRWFTQPQQPGCDDGKFAFCCQLGPSSFRQMKNKPIATEEQKQENERRLRKCRNCK